MTRTLLTAVAVAMISLSACDGGDVEPLPECALAPGEWVSSNHCADGSKVGDDAAALCYVGPTKTISGCRIAISHVTCVDVCPEAAR